MNGNGTNDEKNALATVQNDIVETDTPEQEVYRVDQEGDPETMLSVLEAKARLAPRFKAARDSILVSQTYPSDWKEFDGKMCLSSAGAERVGMQFDIKLSEVTWKKEEWTDSIGKAYRYIYSCRATLGNRVSYAEGIYSTRDDFLGKKDHKYRPLEEIDENDIRRAALNIMKGNAIKGLLGLRGLPRDEWAAIMVRAGADPQAAGKVEHGKGTQGGTDPEDHRKQKELAELCIAIANAGKMVVTQDHKSFDLAAAESADPMDVAKLICVTLSTFVNDQGKTIGGKGAKDLKGKWLESTLKKTREMHAQL
jgi:hypothetical protein